ncbi:NADH pyrophosphatase zinc ribbon domain-containing protein [Halapricum sp. CBA1109]|nr:NADH pyrophosphatase zinc ribbon domain-containing protein [Halapricum sp. CBA1109]
MTDVLICAACGTGFEHDADDFTAVCPDCGTRYHPRTGAC